MPFERHVIETPPAAPDAKPLALKNAHARDARIAFRDHDHAYFVYEPESDTHLRVTRSVSGIHARYSTPFESYETALKVVKKRKFDKTSPYYWFLQARTDLDDDEGAARAICDAWNQNGSRSSGLGTKCHAALEDYLNGLPIGEWENDEKCSPLVRAGTRWIDEKVDSDGWSPWRTEYSIFIDGHNADREADRPALEAHAALVAGQVDAIFVDEDGRHHMVDWKFCGKEKLDKRNGEFRGARQSDAHSGNAPPHPRWLCSDARVASCLSRRAPTPPPTSQTTLRRIRATDTIPQGLHGCPHLRASSLGPTRQQRTDSFAPLPAIRPKASSRCARRPSTTCPTIPTAITCFNNRFTRTCSRSVTGSSSPRCASSTSPPTRERTSRRWRSDSNLSKTTSSVASFRERVKRTRRGTGKSSRHTRAVRDSPARSADARRQNSWRTRLPSCSQCEEAHRHRKLMAHCVGEVRPTDCMSNSSQPFVKTIICTVLLVMKHLVVET